MSYLGGRRGAEKKRKPGKLRKGESSIQRTLLDLTISKDTGSPVDEPGFHRQDEHFLF